MTEYWVSQGNKWCDFCKIFISNNPSSIRNHELGTRHKENVSKRLASMRKDNAAKEKEQKEAALAIEQIEAKASRSYQKDVAKLQEARDSNAHDFLEGDEEKWEHDSTSGYYYNSSNGLYFDQNSGFYYSDAIGKWVTQEEAYATVSSNSKFKGPAKTKSFLASTGPASENKGAAKSQSAPHPSPGVSSSLNPKRSIKGAPSSIAVKRKRQNTKPKAISEEEAAALKAREAAKKRVEAREKTLHGLYTR